MGFNSIKSLITAMSGRGRTIPNLGRDGSFLPSPALILAEIEPCAIFGNRPVFDCPYQPGVEVGVMESAGSRRRPLMLPGEALAGEALLRLPLGRGQLADRQLAVDRQGSQLDRESFAVGV